jgi:glycerol kinase
MQIQADILGIPVVKPEMTETTAFGAALAAGKAIGLWDLKDSSSIPYTFDKFYPSISNEGLFASKIINKLVF